jgi:hypothetical protein
MGGLTLKMKENSRVLGHSRLTPKHLRPFFGPFLKFGQAIVDAIFVQKSQIFGEHVV